MNIARVCTYIITVSFASTVNSSSYEKVEIISRETNQKLYDTIEDMSKFADLIVIATPIQSFSQAEHIKISDFYYSYRKVRIEKVLKNPDNSNFKKGDVIQVVEQSALTKINGQMVQITDDNYIPVRKGKRYIFFTRLGNPDRYVIMNRNLGRLAIKEEDVKQAYNGPTEAATAKQLLLEAVEKFNLKY